MQHARIARTINPPTADTTGMKMGLLSLIQLDISLPTLAPWQAPLEHLPPPWQLVPSRKFCCMVKHMFGPNSGDAQDSWQPWELQECVSLPEDMLPIRVLHCRSRDVHWPEAQARPAPEAPQPVPSGAVTSAGQFGEAPVHVSCGSHTPVLARHTVPLLANLQEEVQHSSLAGSQTALVVNLQVVGLQQGLVPQPCVPPQSQSSPCSTMPLPHCDSAMVLTSRLLVRQLDLTLLRPMAEQMLPTLQGENCVMPPPVEGFMMKAALALQLDWERGQHCCLVTVPSEQVWDVQSWTAPKVWPVSWAMTCHSVLVQTTTLAAAIVSFWLLAEDSCEPCTHTWPSQARPTAESVPQVLRRVQ